MDNVNVISKVLAKSAYSLTNIDKSQGTFRSVTHTGSSNRKFVSDSSSYIRYRKTLASYK